MVDDIVRELGLMTLGSRMKRIGERLQSDAVRIAAARGAIAQAGQYAFLGALDAGGELTIGELATAVGITQLEVCVRNGLTTIQSAWPAVRSIRSMACEPLASRVLS